MAARQTRVGERQGMLVCLSEYEKDNKWFLVCECDCGKTKHINQAHFRQIRSCGCIKAVTSALNGTTHGMSNSKEYQAWDSMKDRCLKPNHPAYHNYGGRGISICERWVESFSNFFSDMGYAPSKEHSLDRIDVNGDYCADNCRWATWEEQQNNRRNNVSVTMNGETRNLYSWCKEYGVSMQFIHHRVKNMGMTYEEAFSVPKMWQPA